MHILLVNPYVHDFAAFDLWAKPLGLLYIASFLAQQDYSISFIDCLDRHHAALSDTIKEKRFGTGKYFETIIDKPNLLNKIPRHFKRFGIPLDVFRNDLANLKTPDLILVGSGMTYWYHGIRETIKIIKEFFPNTSIMLGGLYARLCTQHAEKMSGADIISTACDFTSILKEIDRHTGTQHNYSKIKNNIDHLPYPAYNLYSRLKTIAMLTSLGCPHKCAYCASSFLYERFFERNPHNVFKELFYYHERYHICDIAFYDDALLINADKRFIPLAEEIIAHKLPIRFHTPNGLHVRAITQRIAQLLFNAGFKTIRLSFESSNKLIQKLSSSKVSNDNLVTAVTCLTGAGYQKEDIDVYLLVGLPKQKYTDVKESILFVHGLGLKIKLAEYAPIPHTSLFSYLRKDTSLLINEPLLHNNSVYTYLDKNFGDKLEELKALTKNLNAKLQPITNE